MEEKIQIRGSFIFELVSDLRLYISQNPNLPKRRALCNNEKVAITLYYLKNCGALNMATNSFEIATNIASPLINEAFKAIGMYVGPKYLYLSPQNQEMMDKIAEFETKFGMTQAFGCIDGTYILIVWSCEHSLDYFCYKQFHSLIVQAVCDYKGAYMDNECTWLGSVHDAKGFESSSFRKSLRNSNLPAIFQTISNSEVKILHYIIGDRAFPLLPYYIREYSTCKSDEKVAFISVLKSAHNPIEYPFGRLKARWQVLTKKNKNGFQT